MDFSTRIADRRGVNTLHGEAHEVIYLLGDAGTRSPEDEARADNDRPTNLFGDHESLIGRMREARLGNREADVGHRGLEEFAILGGVDGLGPRADDLDTQSLGHAAANEFHGEIERGLAAQGGQQRVGALTLENVSQHVGVERFDVGDVGGSRIGHNRRRIRVHENDLEAIVAQHLTGLGPGVIELTGLTNHERARTDHQNARDITATWHYVRSN